MILEIQENVTEKEIPKTKPKPPFFISSVCNLLLRSCFSGSHNHLLVFFFFCRGDESPVGWESGERWVRSGALSLDVPRLSLLGPRLHVMRRRLLLRPRRALHHHRPRRSQSLPLLQRRHRRRDHVGPQHPHCRRSHLSLSLSQMKLDLLLILSEKAPSQIIKIIDKERASAGHSFVPRTPWLDFI